MNNITIMLLIFTIVILLIMMIILLIKIRKIEKKYQNFISKFDNKKSIEETLEGYFQVVNRVNEENNIIKSNYVNLERKVAGCVQKIGIVRYNAFDDVGSNLSFALAILNDEDNGVVINSIYGRTSSNIYAKSIENGTSKYVLSEEEIEAVTKAKNE